MTTRQIRIGLWIITTIMGTLAAVSVLWATAPLDRPNVAIAAPGSTSPKPSPSQVESINAGELKQLCEVNLRRPLRDPPPMAPPPPPPAQPPPPLSIHLSGTIIEPGHSQALIAMPDGTVQIKNVGESAGNARISEIREGSITVEYFGQSQVLNVAQENKN